jgi:hypothetical protein
MTKRGASFSFNIYFLYTPLPSHSLPFRTSTASLYIIYIQLERTKVQCCWNLPKLNPLHNSYLHLKGLSTLRKMLQLLRTFEKTQFVRYVRSSSLNALDMWQCVTFAENAASLKRLMNLKAYITCSESRCCSRYSDWLRARQPGRAAPSPVGWSVSMSPYLSVLLWDQYSLHSID